MPQFDTNTLNRDILCVVLKHLDAETQLWFPRKQKYQATGEMSAREAFIQHPEKILRIHWNYRIH